MEKPGAYSSYPWCRWFKSSFRYYFKDSCLRVFFQYIILCDSAFFQSVLQVLCYGSDGNPIGRCIGKREEIIKNLNSCIYICEKAINEGGGFYIMVFNRFARLLICLHSTRRKLFFNAKYL